jgi:hypothetical protein
MEILLAFFTTGIVELIKILSPKLGLEKSKKLIFGSLLIVVLIFTYMTRTGLLPMALVKQYLEILLTAVGTYTLLIKPIKESLNI